MNSPLPIRSIIAALERVAREGALAPGICAAASSAASSLRGVNVTPSPFDEELTVWGVELATYYMERGVSGFGNLSKALLRDMDGVPRSKVRPYLPVWYGGAHGLLSLAE